MPRRESPRASPAVLRADQVEAFSAGGDELVTGEAVALDLRPTSIVLRGAGVVIDYLVYAAGVVALIILVGLLNDAGALDDALAQALVIGSVAFGLIVVPAIVETATHGRSLGRLAVGARIVRIDGGAIGFRHALTRSLVGLLEIVLTTGGLAVVVGLLNGSSRRLGDLMAGTYSRNERLARDTRVVAVLPPGLEGWAGVADVARLPDGTARRVAAFVQQEARLTPASRRRVAEQLADEVRPFVSPLPDVDAPLLLTAVAVLRRDRESTALAREAATLARLQPALTGTVPGFPRR
ncbi:RDD family protein [Frigoribacterium sp. Leaf172]|uniref:RDD family protein n=1 Tax=Frigoribacterium sp. Leaf172 TaxID=1736285 RepID=UPI0009EC3B40|nr:RDD family protein [Frigoribacterium sp. Leaf172]